MHRLSILLILTALLAACTGATTEPASPHVIETESLPPSETLPAADSVTSTAEPSPTEEPPTPTLEPSPTPTDQPEGLDRYIAYISTDSNLWIMNQISGESIAITEDAIPFQPNITKETISYCCAQFSSDGSLLAYRRELGNVTEQLFETTYSFWVYDLSSGESRLLLDQLVRDYEWEPGEHIIAYGPEIAFEYFTVFDYRAQYASGIWAIEVDSGESYELIAPERGFALNGPRWSPDGRFLSFEEVQYMEGRGLFAYYDFDAQEYIAWDEILGNYDWSPDGELLAYDAIAYVSGGTERIWLRERMGDAREFAPLFDSRYSFHPVFSPQGDRIAYLAAIGSMETTQYTLMVQDLDSTEPRELGTFAGVYEFSWSSDGAYIVFAAGPYEQREVVQVLVEDGTTTELVEGAQPAVQP